MLFNRRTSQSQRHRVLGIRCGTDPVLHAVAPLGLAAARGTALVVDLDRDAPSYPGSTSLAALVTSQPRLDDLRPRRSGVAVLSNGMASPGEIEEVMEALVSGWPTVVLRLGASQDLPPSLTETPVVPVAPLFPGFLHPPSTGPGVFQAMSVGPPPSLRGVVLPPLARSHIYRMLGGLGFPPRRWVSAWEKVWNLPWR